MDVRCGDFQGDNATRKCLHRVSSADVLWELIKLMICHTVEKAPRPNIRRTLYRDRPLPPQARLDPSSRRYCPVKTSSEDFFERWSKNLIIWAPPDLSVGLLITLENLLPLFFGRGEWISTSTWQMLQERHITHKRRSRCFHWETNNNTTRIRMILIIDHPDIYTDKLIKLWARCYVFRWMFLIHTPSYSQQISPNISSYSYKSSPTRRHLQQPICTLQTVNLVNHCSIMFEAIVVTMPVNAVSFPPGHMT